MALDSQEENNHFYLVTSTRLQYQSCVNSANRAELPEINLSSVETLTNLSVQKKSNKPQDVIINFSSPIKSPKQSNELGMNFSSTPIKHFIDIQNDNHVHSHIKPKEVAINFSCSKTKSDANVYNHIKPKELAINFSCPKTKSFSTVHSSSIQPKELAIKFSCPNESKYKENDNDIWPEIPLIRGSSFSEENQSFKSLREMENDKNISSLEENSENDTNSTELQNQRSYNQIETSKMEEMSYSSASEEGINMKKHGQHSPTLNVNPLNQLGSKTVNVMKNSDSLFEQNSSPLNLNPLNQLGNNQIEKLKHINLCQNMKKNDSSFGQNSPTLNLNPLNQLGKNQPVSSLNNPGNRKPKTTENDQQKQLNGNVSSSLNENPLNAIEITHQTQINRNISTSLNQNPLNTSSSWSSSEGTPSNSDSDNSDNIQNDEQDPCKFFSNEFYTVMYSNIDQSLTGKMSELLGHVDRYKPNIIMLTETELKCKNDQTKQVKESEISIPNYTLFTNEKKKRGVAVYVETKMDARECTKDINENFDECVFCEFDGVNKEKVLIGCMYKSPNSSKSNVENMMKTIRNENLNKYDVICIAGDFNYPKIKWEGGGQETGENDLFVECLKDAFLEQKVTKPTRNVRINQKANIVDLVLINDDKMISDIVHMAPLGNSDHDVLYFQLNLPRRKVKEEKKKRFNVGKGNYKDMRKNMAKVNWSKLDDMNVEQAWEKIEKEIIHNMNKFIPKTKMNQSMKTKPCWMNDKVLRKIKKKYHAYKRFLVTKQGEDYQRYINKRNACTREIRKAKKKHEDNIAKDSKTNPSKFWKYVNDKCKTNVGISSLRDDKGKLIDTDKGKADILNNFFTSVFLKEDTSNLPNVEEASFASGIHISDIRVTKDAVEKKLKELNPQKAQGPDQIPPRVLKELHKELALPLSKLFNKSLETGVVPKKWKSAEVTAIFKKGNKTDPGNYRPVSLTCICCKLLEQFVRDEIVKHMTDNNLYSECQHGFRKKRSCVTQLLEVYDQLTEMIDDGKSVDIIYLDFRKAFDSIPHERLLRKMAGYGITGGTLKWVRDFLCEREQRVRVGNEYSNVTKVTSGIPQGSILGPVLFTIFINDLPENMNVHCKVFADDTKIYEDVKKKDAIQQDLYKLQEWTELWNLYFNVSKCKVMHIGKKNPKTEYYMMMEGSQRKLDTCAEEKDLGITFDTNMKFDIHISNIVKKANQMLGVIKRTFTFKSKSIFLKLYKALVRSHLEYGNVIWNPHLKRQSIQIERVQRRATKLVPECKDMSYEERLKYLNLHSLKGRRLRGDMIQVYKIFNGLDDLDANKLLPLSTYSGTRGQGQKLKYRYSKCDIRKYSFANRVIEHWNNLPLDIKNAKTINTFKNRIDNYPILCKKFYDYDEN